MLSNVKDKILESMIHGKHTSSFEIANSILERQEVVVSYIQELQTEHLDWFLTGEGYGDDHLTICLHPLKIPVINEFLESGGYKAILEKDESDKQLDRYAKTASIQATKIASRSFVVSIIATVIALVAMIISLMSK